MLEALTALPDQVRSIALPRGRIGLHSVPTAAGLERRTDPSYSWDGMRRGSTPFVVVQHTLAGEGRLDYEGRRLTLGPGTTMLVHVPHRHRYFLPPDGDWRFFFLVLTGREVLYLADEIVRAAGPVLTLGTGSADRLATICARLLETRAWTPGSASALAYEAMTVLFDHTAANTLSSAQDHPDWVRPVLTYIQQNVASPLPVAALADIAGMSRAHFVRQFTKALGTAPSEFIFRLRMQRAAHLLEVSPASIVTIAAECGFQNPNYFAKAFRRAFDVSPSEFRASGMYTMGRG